MLSGALALSVALVVTVAQPQSRGLYLQTTGHIHPVLEVSVYQLEVSPEEVCPQEVYQLEVSPEEVYQLEVSPEEVYQLEM
jgi:hypothetical protein